MNLYEFPVSLQKLYTRDGNEAPRVQAVVREDTNEPLAVVGKRYQLIPHSDVVRQARSFINAMGTPTESFTVARNGAVMLGVLTYKEHTHTVAKGDTVGLRVYIENSYNATRSLNIRVGALVLSCLNGMVTPRNIYNYVWRHTTDVVIKFPDPGQILESFGKESNRWASYGDIALSSRSDQIGEAYHQLEPVLGSGMLDAVRRETNGEGKTVWDFTQACTYQLTHTSKASMVGKLNKLDAVSRIIDETLVRGVIH
jgi:hypothetical protein